MSYTELKNIQTLLTKAANAPMADVVHALHAARLALDTVIQRKEHLHDFQKQHGIRVEARQQTNGLKPFR